MAYSTSSYFTNSIIGETVDDFNCYALHASPKYAVGKRVALEDGRVYRYAHFSGDITVGAVVGPDISEVGLGVTDNSIIASASAVNTSDGLIGSRFIEITVASIAAGQYAGGYLHTEDDAGEGFVYRIKSNTATDDPATGNIRIELFEPLQVAVTTATDVAITPCLWNNVEGATAATDYIVGGVALAARTAATYPWGWVQTWGPCTVQADGAITAGDQLSLSDSEAGTVQILGGGGSTGADILAEQIVGYALYAGTDNAQVGVYLQICP